MTVLLCLQIAPHILIHWRPDNGNFKAYMTRKAPAGEKVDTNPAIEMSVLPNTKGTGNFVKQFTMFHTSKGDDSELMNFICGMVVSAGVGCAQG